MKENDRGKLWKENENIQVPGEYHFPRTLAPTISHNTQRSKSDATQFPSDRHSSLAGREGPRGHLRIRPRRSIIEQQTQPDLIWVIARSTYK